MGCGVNQISSVELFGVGYVCGFSAACHFIICEFQDVEFTLFDYQQGMDIEDIEDFSSPHSTQACIPCEECSYLGKIALVWI